MFLDTLIVLIKKTKGFIICFPLVTNHSAPTISGLVDIDVFVNAYEESTGLIALIQTSNQVHNR